MDEGSTYTSCCSSAEMEMAAVEKAMEGHFMGRAKAGEKELRRCAYVHGLVDGQTLWHMPVQGREEAWGGVCACVHVKVGGPTGSQRARWGWSAMCVCGCVCMCICC